MRFMPRNRVAGGLIPQGVYGIKKIDHFNGLAATFCSGPLPHPAPTVGEPIMPENPGERPTAVPRKRFRGRTLSRDLTISLVLAVLVTSAFFTALAYWIAAKDARRQMAQKADEYLSYLVDSLELPVWSIDEEGVRRIAASFMRSSLVASLDVVDATDNQLIFEAKEASGPDLLIKERPILHKDQLIGTVRIGLTPRPYRENLNTLLRSTLRNTLIIVLVLFVMTGLLLRLFLKRPLDALIRGIERISQGDYAYSLQDFKQQDMRAIVAKFQSMAEQVRSRQNSLEALNRQLETGIQEQRRTEEALRKSEERFRGLVNQAADPFFLHDLAGRLLDVNELACKSLGYTREELLALCVEDIETGLSPSQIETTQSALAAGQQITLQGRHRRKDGTTFPVEARLGMIELADGPAVLALVRDITERLQAEEALKQSHETLRAILDGIDATVFVAEMETHEILFANKFLKDLFGQQLEGEHCWRVLRGGSGPCANCTNDKLLGEDGKPTGVCVWEDKNPVTKRWFINYDRAIKWIDGRYVRLEIATDITDVKRLEAERRKTEAQLHKAQRFEAIGTLAGGIAHDFNNLLMGIQGNASLMMEEIAAEDPHRDRLQHIEDYIRQGVDLTRQLLGFAKGGKYEVKPVDLNRLIGRTAEMFARTRKEIVVRQHYAVESCNIEADEGQMEQVFMNLFVNAWQAMPGGGELSIRTAKVRLDAEAAGARGLPAGRYVKVAVTDTGIGMDAETQQRIFDPFFSTKGMGSGTGLGLASAYGIVSNHRGHIEVDSREGLGTTFIILLPASDRRAAAERPAAARPLTGNETLMLVDDEPTILEVGSQMLRKLGYTVLTAGEGEEAIRVFRENQGAISLVILDLVMPEMGGGEVYDRLKAIDPSLKALLSSGYSIDGQASEILQRGCNGFIQKPFDLVSISNKVRELLDGR